MREIKKIVLSGTELPLKKNQVVCFVGANSSGKSSALEGIFKYSVLENTTRKSSIDSIEVESFETDNDIETALTDKAVFVGGSLKSSLFSTDWGTNANAKSIVVNELKGNQFTQYNKFFHHLINAQNRFEGVNPINNIDYTKGFPTHPLHFIYKDPELEKRLSEISKAIFGIELSLNPGLGVNLHLHIGERINAKNFGGDRSQKYANELGNLPLIETAGDGYKAAIGLLGQILTSNASAIFVDEPDLYLHPPQAFQLAKTVCQQKSDSQLFFSTHSARFAQGLFEAASDRLILIRLSKSGNKFTANTVDSKVFKDIKNDPVLKFSQISEGMFYEKTFLCEDGSDCLFYQNGIDKLDLEKSENSSLWIGINGKGNFGKVAKTARKLGLNPICIADFDILSDKNDSCTKVLKPLIAELSETEDSNLIKEIDKIVQMISADINLNWDILKTQGIDATSSNGSLHSKIEKLLGALKLKGIILVPNGEVESLHVPRIGKGLDAINQMLNKDIVTDPQLQKARDFLKSAFG